MYFPIARYAIEVIDVITVFLMHIILHVQKLRCYAAYLKIASECCIVSGGISYYR